MGTENAAVANNEQTGISVSGRNCNSTDDNITELRERLFYIEPKHEFRQWRKISGKRVSLLNL